MTDKFFNFLDDNDPLSVFKDQFSSIKYIDFYVPNRVNSFQTIVIVFKDKTIKKIKVKNYFNFQNKSEKTNVIFSMDSLNQMKDKTEFVYKYNDLHDHEIFSQYIHTVSR